MSDVTLQGLESWHRNLVENLAGRLLLPPKETFTKEKISYVVLNI